MSALGAGRPAFLGGRLSSLRLTALPRPGRRTQTTPGPRAPQAMAGAESLLVQGNVLSMDAFLPALGMRPEIAVLASAGFAVISGEG